MNESYYNGDAQLSFTVMTDEDGDHLYVSVSDNELHCMTRFANSHQDMNYATVEAHEGVAWLCDELMKRLIIRPHYDKSEFEALCDSLVKTYTNGFPYNHSFTINYVRFNLCYNPVSKKRQVTVAHGNNEMVCTLCDGRVSMDQLLTHPQYKQLRECVFNLLDIKSTDFINMSHVTSFVHEQIGRLANFK